MEALSSLPLRHAEQEAMMSFSHVMFTTGTLTALPPPPSPAALCLSFFRSFHFPNSRPLSASHPSKPSPPLSWQPLQRFLQSLDGRRVGRRAGLGAVPALADCHKTDAQQVNRLRAPAVLSLVVLPLVDLGHEAVVWRARHLVDDAARGRG